MTKWYMHKPESVQENETHMMLWDFELQTDQPEDLKWWSLKKKEKKGERERERKREKEKKMRNCWMVNFIVLVDHCMKIQENENRDKCQRTKKKQRDTMMMMMIP